MPPLLEEAVADADVPAMEIAPDEIRGERVVAVALPGQHAQADVQPPLVSREEAPSERRPQFPATGPAAECVLAALLRYQDIARGHRVDVQLRLLAHVGQRRTKHPVEAEARTIPVAL